MFMASTTEVQHISAHVSELQPLELDPFPFLISGEYGNPKTQPERHTRSVAEAAPVLLGVFVKPSRVVCRIRVVRMKLQPKFLQN